MDIKGTVVPPHFSDFRLMAGLDADLRGSFDITVAGQVGFDSGKVKLYEVGIPGLDFPG